MVNEAKLELLRERGDLEGWRRGLDSARQLPNPQNPSGAIFASANLAVVEGRGREALRLLREGWRIDSSTGRPVPAVFATLVAVGQKFDAGLPFESELRAFEAQLEKAPLSSLPSVDAPYFDVAALFARAGRPGRAREVLAQYRAAVRDTARLRSERPRVDDVMAWIAHAEGRWAEAVQLMRSADSLPDGPAHSCSACLPRALVELFADAGMADSALAQYEAYRRTPLGSRPRTGPDLQIRALVMEAVGKMYDSRGDTARAVEAYRDFVERWKNADPEVQPRVAAARQRIVALTPVERVRDR
jgi:tetratricopeptide (TPR) repeat protein